MYKKYKITGVMEVVTGLHIGGSTQYSPIGSVDSPVIRDTFTNQPIVPGSSLKGKMRFLLAESENRGKITNKPIFDPVTVTRLFGAPRPSSKEREQREPLDDKVIPARLQFRDMKVKEPEKLMKERFLDSLTEVKFENTINRSTGVATPRQIERVVPGVQFNLDIIYNAVFENENFNEIKEDFELINKAFVLLQYDYLGGNGSRGHGKVSFKDIEVTCVFDSENENPNSDKLVQSLKDTLNKNLENGNLKN